MKYLDYAEDAGLALGYFNDEIKDRLKQALKLLANIEGEKDIKPKDIRQVSDFTQDLIEWAESIENLMSELKETKGK